MDTRQTYKEYSLSYVIVVHFYICNEFTMALFCRKVQRDDREPLQTEYTCYKVTIPPPKQLHIIKLYTKAAVSKTSLCSEI